MRLSVIAFSIGYKIGRKIKQLWEAITTAWCNPPQDDIFAMELLAR
ncbi:MAG: hypothetical protein QNJ68_09770 [Microcoleaceae cyanobacterium MO_207.B10]|nr:hypothetical protein [Microcoleaceae cyanobacterium MO_207.B10]